MAGLDDVAKRLAQISGGDDDQRRRLYETLCTLMELLIEPAETRITARHEAQIHALEESFKPQVEVWATYGVLAQALARERRLMLKNAFMAGLQGRLYVPHPLWLLRRVEECQAQLEAQLDEDGRRRLTTLLGLTWQETRELMAVATQVAARIRTLYKEDTDAH